MLPSYTAPATRIVFKGGIGQGNVAYPHSAGVHTLKPRASCSRLGRLPHEFRGGRVHPMTVDCSGCQQAGRSVACQERARRARTGQVSVRARRPKQHACARSRLRGRRNGRRRT
jgi:hypothetical protein